MGTRYPPPEIPPDVPAGTDCGNCWGVGKPFGDGDTPSTITATFSGINEADDWVPANGPGIDGEFILTQVGGQPCLFRFLDADYLIECTFFAAMTIISVIWQTIITPFVGITNEPCDIWLYNDQVNAFVDGTCQIAIPGVDP